MKQTNGVQTVIQANLNESEELICDALCISCR
jgi:hypothetical protein